MGDSAYSFSLTTFSPSGKLLQIEYALTAVAAGATSLGIKVRGVGARQTQRAPSPSNPQGVVVCRRELTTITALTCIDRPIVRGHGGVPCSRG
jgi:hypothetical protein